MSLNAAALEILVAKGLTGEDILAVARALESTSQKADSAAERRRAYDRERKREQREEQKSGGMSGGMSGGNPADPSPQDNILNPLSLPSSNELGDPEKILFSSGIAILTATGVTEQKARTCLGKWKRDHGAAETIVALSRAQREGALEPIAFIEGCFRQQTKARTYDKDRITV